MIQQISHHADAITRAQDFTRELISTFSEKYKEPLVLTRADHFALLADCINLIEYESSAMAREGALSFGRYDVAALLCQHHLKSHLVTLLAPDQHHAFIDAIFPKLYSKSRNEYGRMISDIDHLIRAIPEADLSNELESVKREWETIRVARDQGFALNSSNYTRSFVDAFHNPMLDHCAPMYCYFGTGKEASSLTEIREQIQYYQDLSTRV